jgi:RecG-like helicase
MILFTLVFTANAETTGIEISTETDGYFVYQLNEDGASYRIIEYTGDEKTVVVPETYNDLPVTVIGERAFLDSTLCNIELSENIKEIEDKIQKDIEPILEIKEQVTEMVENQNAFNEAITKNPDSAEAIIKNEIKKAEELKDTIEKIIKTHDTKSKKKTISNMTNWWNGMGYDF